MLIEVGVGQRTLVVHLRVIKLTFQMEYYSVELCYITYGVKTSPPYTRGHLFKSRVHEVVECNVKIQPSLKDTVKQTHN